MKIVHHIFSNWNEDQVGVLKEFGIKASAGFHSIELEEGAIYAQLKRFLVAWDVADARIARFSDQDYQTAALLMFTPKWQPLYPQPEKDFRYLQTTYDNTNYCL